MIFGFLFVDIPVAFIMFSRTPAQWTGATHGYTKGIEVVEFKMAVGVSNVASVGCAPLSACS
jgi:hypothetical protein